LEEAKMHRQRFYLGTLVVLILVVGLLAGCAKAATPTPTPTPTPTIVVIPPPITLPSSTLQPLPTLPSLPSPTVAPPLTGAGARVIATPSAIMRVNATSASARVTAVAYGQNVKLLEQNVAGQELTIAGYTTSNLWHKVEWGGYTGYIWAPLLQVQ
jgi:hypothetical protein